MKKFECDNCTNQHCYAENIQGEKPSKCLFDIYWDVDWREVKVESKLPKLTVEALKERGIEWPDDAKYAAVSKSGLGHFYKDRPFPYKPCDCTGYWKGTEIFRMIGVFDASDWQNSLIARPAVVKENLITELPEWCRVGAWVRIDSPGLGHGEIRRIKEIQHKQDGQWIVFDPLKGNHLVIGGSKNLTRFAVRPWTFTEAPARLKIAKRSGEVLDLDLCVILSEGTGCYYYIDNRRSMIEASELVKQIQPDGSPCGVLEVVE